MKATMLMKKLLGPELQVGAGQHNAKADDGLKERGASRCFETNLESFQKLCLEFSDSTLASFLFETTILADSTVPQLFLLLLY